MIRKYLQKIAKWFWNSKFIQSMVEKYGDIELEKADE